MGSCIFKNMYANIYAIYNVHNENLWMKLMKKDMNLKSLYVKCKYSLFKDLFRLLLVVALIIFIICIVDSYIPFFYFYSLIS